jgi:hypothetical protein
LFIIQNVPFEIEINEIAFSSFCAFCINRLESETIESIEVLSGLIGLTLEMKALIKRRISIIFSYSAYSI